MSVRGAGSIRQRAAFARLFLCRRVKPAPLVPLIPLLYTISYKDGVMRMQKIARVCAAVCAAVFLAACANEITIEPKQIPDTGSEWQNTEYTAQFKTDGTWSVTAKKDSAAVQSLSGEYRGETVRSGTVNMEVSSFNGEQTDSLRTTAAVTENTLSFSASWNGKTFSETFTRAQSVTGVTLQYNNGEPVTALTLPAGMFAELSAAVTPSGALVQSVSWSSSNSKIVSVDSSGKITAVSPGTATVTAVSDSVSGVSASCTVTVTLDGLQLSHQEVSVNPGESFQLQCFPDISVSWTSSDPERVSVSESGLLTAAPWSGSPLFGKKDPEPVTITAAASVNGVTQSALCTVTIVNNRIQITPAERTLMAGDSESFSVSPVYGEDTGNLIKDIKWSVEPEGIVSLPSDTANATITVTANKNVSGTARLTVSAQVNDEPVESSAVITVVNDPTVTGIKIDPLSVTLTEQTKSKELLATVTGAGDLTAEQVIWSSSDTSVAKVSDTGLVTAQGKGLAVIKAVSQSNPAVYAVCPVWVEAEPEAVTIWQLAGEQGALETGIIASFGLSDAVFYDNGTWSISSSKAQYAEGFASGMYPENTDTTLDRQFTAQVTDTALGIGGLTADISITGGAQNLGVQITVPGIGDFTFKFIRKQ